MIIIFILLLGSLSWSAHAEGLPETIVRRYPVGEMRSCAATLTITSNASMWAYEVKLDQNEWRLGPRFALEKNSKGSVITGLVGREVLHHTIPSLTTGPHRIEVRAIDKTGRRDRSPFVAEWTVHEPVLEFVSQMPPRVAPLSDHWVEVKSTSAKYAFDYSIDDGLWQYGDANIKGGRKGVLVGDKMDDILRLIFVEAPRTERQRVRASGVTGSHSISLRPVDQCGNRGAAVSSTWVTSWASTLMHEHPPSGVVSQSAVVFAASSDLPSFFVEYSLNGGEWVRSSKVSKPGVPVRVELSQLEEGSHELHIRALDSYGRPDYQTKDYIWTMDNSLPVLHVTSALPSRSSPATLEVAIEIEDASPTTLYFQLDGGQEWSVEVLTKNKARWYHRLELKQLSDGEHSLRVRAVDLAGNWDDLGSQAEDEENQGGMVVPFSVDAAPPTTHMAEGPERYTSDRLARFWFTVSERRSTMMYSLDDAPFQKASDPMLEFANLADGPHSMRVYCIDAAGNEEQEHLLHQWNVDTIPPHTAIHAGWGTLDSPKFAVSGLPGDGETWDSFVYNFEYRVDDDDWVPGERHTRLGPGYEVMLSGLSPGQHVFTARALDLAGNVDTQPASHSFNTPVPATGSWAASASEVEMSSLDSNAKNQPSVGQAQMAESFGSDVARAMDDNYKEESRGWFGFRTPRRTFGARSKFLGELRR
eukprot:CAMPEP_0196576644 /NCGR_PEP_ID=MMETSP1081-20130531/5857_1 /TAXON_ID=36882 /ORGANISM="Pyramimonas amylifera, Strain CCMP720" /LENGTH=700 /DNA_ID=CAMNT_0041895311 /DNA_START=342 /DNA_END=2444 /DNA_ORIENTATION=-